MSALPDAAREKAKHARSKERVAPMTRVIPERLPERSEGKFIRDPFRRAETDAGTAAIVAS